MENSSPSKFVIIGLLVGALLGLLANAIGHEAAWLNWILSNVAVPGGQIFLRLLFLLVVPLLFSALVVGFCELDVLGLGRVGGRTLGFAAVFSLIAVVLGLVLVNWLEPGVGIPDSVRALATNSAAISTLPKPPEATGASLISSMIPDNPVKAAATGDMIGVIFFALIFGFGLSVTKTPAAIHLRTTITGIYDVSMTLINAVMKLAPIGVGLLVFAMTARLGSDLLLQMFAYVGVVLLGLSLQMFVVYALVLRLQAGRNPLVFFRDIRPALVTAFATASSSATLPVALRVAEENLHLPGKISRFVLTAGSAMNQHGTALFEGVTVLFLAQVFNVPLDLGQQFLIMLICVLGGIGTAGIPAGSLPVIAMILVTFNIPVEGLSLVLGVDRLLDMCRTTLNVGGDLVAAAYVSHVEEKRETASHHAQ